MWVRPRWWVAWTTWTDLLKAAERYVFTVPVGDLCMADHDKLLRLADAVKFRLHTEPQDACGGANGD